MDRQLHKSDGENTVNRGLNAVVKPEYSGCTTAFNPISTVFSPSLLCSCLSVWLYMDTIQFYK